MSAEEVRIAHERFYDAFQKLDLESMSRLWARDIDVSCVHPGWDLISGYEAVMQGWRMIFEGTSDLRVRIDEPRVISNEGLAWVVCKEVLFTTVQGMPVENVLTAINTFVRENDEWRIAHHHAAPILAGRPKVESGPEPVLH